MTVTESPKQGRGPIVVRDSSVDALGDELSDELRETVLGGEHEAAFMVVGNDSVSGCVPLAERQAAECE